MTRIKLVPAEAPPNIHVASSCIYSMGIPPTFTPGQYVYRPGGDGYPGSWELVTEVPDAPVDIEALQDEAERLEARLREIYKQLA